ncbi:MAG: hypothetical protein R6V26_05360 [Roseovarius sp.]
MIGKMFFSPDFFSSLLSALKYALTMAISNIGAGNAEIAALKRQNHPIFNKLFVSLTVARSCAKRLQDDELQDQVIRNLQFSDKDTLGNLRGRLEHAFNAVVASQLDDHFIDENAIELFDRAELNREEKFEIRELMAAARRAVDNSDELFERQKQKVLFHIAKIENELHKTKSTFQTFVAAASEVSDLIRKVGEDAQPIADAVQKARTITERKVKGYEQIAAEEKPKQLPHHKRDTD